MKLPSFLTVSLVLVASAMAKEEAASDLVGPARASLQRGASRKSSNRRMSPDFDNGEIDSKRVLKAGKGGKGNPCKNARNTLMSINNECLLLSAEIQSIGTVVTDYCTLLDDIADSTPPTIDPLTEVAPLETTGKGMGRNCNF